MSPDPLEVKVAEISSETTRSNVAAPDLAVTLFETAQLAVVTDETHLAQAGSAAIALGVPVLTKEQVATAKEELELTHAVSFVGQIDGLETISPDHLPTLVSQRGLKATYQPEPTDLANALTQLEPGVLFGDSPDDMEEQLQVKLAPPSSTSVHLVTTADNPLAVAQARAAGAEVTLLDQDPRAKSFDANALPSPALTSFDADTLSRWQAALGPELPGGGHLIFDGKRYIALYGSPLSAALGVLGEQGLEATIERAANTAAPYRELTEDEVVPSLEIIVTVASGGAGEDGNYSNEWPAEDFIPYVEAAQAAGQYVVIDFQPGRSDFLSQVKQYEKLLAYPNVGVGLDPEWRLGPDELPLTRIGHVEADEVNQVITYLADYVRDNALPQKALVLHQFQIQMLRDREKIDLSRPELAVVVHADGQGPQAQKSATWAALHKDASADLHWGWKNFYDEDHPMRTPEQTYQVIPLPDFVSYQ